MIRETIYPPSSMAESSASDSPSIRNDDSPTKIPASKHHNNGFGILSFSRKSNKVTGRYRTARDAPFPDATSKTTTTSTHSGDADAEEKVKHSFVDQNNQLTGAQRQQIFKRKYQLWILLVLILVTGNGAHCISIPGTRTFTRTNVALRSSPKTIDDADAENERLLATHMKRSCSKVSFAAGFVDLGLLGSMDVTASPQAFISTIMAIWKVTFGANLWLASAIINPDNRLKRIDDESEKLKGISTLLKTMTWIWRQSAVVLALTATLDLILVWKDRIPFIHHIMSMILVSLVVVTVYTSHRETHELFAELEGAENNNNNNQIEADTTTTLDSLRIQCRVTTRAMALCIAAFWLRIASIPLLTIATGPLWKALLSSLPNLPTPLGLAVSLKRLRAAFLQTGAELLESVNKNNKLPQSMKPQTQYQLSTEQKSFYKQVRSALISEMVLKAIAKIVPLVKQKL